MTDHHGILTTNSLDLGPFALPGRLQGPLVWSGADVGPETYTLELEDDEIREVDQALRSFKVLGLDGDEVSQQNFPLPTLAQHLETISRTIHEGRGFFILRGLGASRYGVEDGVIVYLGISCYIGNQRGQQDRKGNMLCKFPDELKGMNEMKIANEVTITWERRVLTAPAHVTSSKSWTTPVEQRHGIHSSLALPFHTDMGCDILALQVRQSALKGGYTFLSSSWRVFNDLLLQEPEVVQTLFKCNWPVQISTKTGPSYYLAPAFTIHDGKLMVSMDPNRFGPHPRSGPGLQIPSLDASQQYALQRVSETARRTELRLDLQKGDILFSNNWALLHRRDSYDDGSSSRHLVRLWLRNTGLGWSVPNSMDRPWLAAYGSGRKIRLYPLVPMPNYKAPKYSAGSAAFLLEGSSGSEDGD